MSDCTHIREDIGGYVLHALEPAEAEAVRAHLLHCRACAAEYAQLADLPALLDLLPADEAPAPQLPAALEERLLDRYARDRRAAAGPVKRRRRWAWPRPAVAVAVLVAAAAGAAGALVVDGRDAPQMDYFTVQLKAQPAARGAKAQAGLRREPNGTYVHLRVTGLPPDRTIVYELLCERADGAKASAGTFRVDAKGAADVRLTTAARVGEYERLRVVRRAGGLSHAYEQADVLVGGLQ